MATLERAIEMAARAHAGQVDKAGDPYILHPLRMMLALSGETERIVAVLHDVVEDTPWNLDDLRAAGFSPEVVAAVDAVTRRANESYAAFVARAAADPVARRVKVADLEDNMNLRRLRHFTPGTAERLGRYHQAWLMLQGRDGSAST